MRTRILLLAALATLAAVLAAGCGGSGDEAVPAAAQPRNRHRRPSSRLRQERSRSRRPRSRHRRDKRARSSKAALPRIGTMGEIDSLNPFVASTPSPTSLGS